MNLLRGLTAPAWLVGFARGVLEAAVIAGLQAAAAVVAQTPQLGFYAPVLILAIRTAEGIADNIDPAKKRNDGTP